ncbi:hypothetical protein [Methylopila sp. M107]|uniref:hypothetical protein n=1 Tax=Methylopila sp. M107 TaxID=1101190 RepID=UPI00037C2836|nr:hypothetical protein [Methylopila sp. M107]
MPKYEPIDAAVAIETSSSDLAAIKWDTYGIVAEFIIPHDAERLLRVTFDKPCIVRIVDEMALSTEDDFEPTQGLVSRHLAYRVRGAQFESTQSSDWNYVNAPAAHYRFITGWACLDVLSAASPSFAIVDHPR